MERYTGEPIEPGWMIGTVWTSPMALVYDGGFYVSDPVQVRAAASPDLRLAALLVETGMEGLGRLAVELVPGLHDEIVLGERALHVAAARFEARTVECATGPRTT